jgi:hypothetical protein
MKCSVLVGTLRSVVHVVMIDCKRANNNEASKQWNHELVVPAAAKILLSIHVSSLGTPALAQQNRRPRAQKVE